MKKLRARIIALMLTIVGISCTISVLVTILSMNGFFDGREMRVMLFRGMAARDGILLLLFVITVCIWVYAVTHSATNPITELSRALRRVANGDYDVKVDIKEKGEDFDMLAEDFNSMVRQLRTNDNLHKDFSSNISHEFKTPLSIIKGYADLIAAGDIPEEYRSYAEMISEESGRLTTLTANLLRLSSIEESELRVQRACFSLDEQIRQAVLSMDSKWMAKDINVELELGNVTYSGDEELLNQVWLNLIDNAVKFTGEGGNIAIRLENRNSDVMVCVEDSGIGMNSETLENIFHKFYRGDTDSRYEGSGLGLPLAQRIVQMHGGSISAESEPGSGSRFTVMLPIIEC